ncbi:hypothetical protein CMI37_18975 [Candidatus Pacearchaeota archaeon]|nr:hypothetical protein [Candidatus Pacearchaeota archaeon]|tara:strand:+ start:70 stop:1026 length:957 start_codon:yes stop_codon:yes gene_type:complete
MSVYKVKINPPDHPLRRLKPLDESRWEGYQKKHPKRGWGRQAERQVRVDAAPGFRIVPQVQRGSGQVRYHVYQGSEDTGRYALDHNKAMIISHRLWKRSKKAKKNPRSARRNPTWRFVMLLNDGMGTRVPMTVRAASREEASTEAQNRIWARYRAWSVPVEEEEVVQKNPSEKASAYRAYYAQQRAKGRSPKQARADWAQKKAHVKKRAQIAKGVVGVALMDIYKLADKLFPSTTDSLGHTYPGSEFIHSSGMFDWDDDRKIIKAELYRSRDTRTKKGWSEWGVDTPEFIKGLRKIQKRYKPHGLKMTVAVKNPWGGR